VPKGVRHDFTMNSQDSKLYPGLKGAYKRKVTVYVPSQYDPGTAAPFIVVQDAMQAAAMSKILDNMIHEKRLPAMIAIFIASGGGDGKGSQRGLEYDTLSEKYAVFIETEVLPRIEKDYKVTFTKDPEGRATMGGSSGRRLCVHDGLVPPRFVPSRAELFRHFCQSAISHQQGHAARRVGIPRESHSQSERKPLRVWMQVGDKDNGYKQNEATLHNWVMANDRMAAVLKAKDYPYRYVFSAGAGHVDGKVVRQTLPEALLFVWQGYEVKAK